MISEVGRKESVNMTTDLLKRATATCCMVFLLAACGADKSTSALSPSANEGGDAAGENSERHGREEKEPPAPPTEGPIKINECSAEELVAYKVSGLGQAKAAAIVAYRDEHGPFRSEADVDKAPGVGEAMMAKLQERGFDFGDLPPEASGSSATAAAGATTTAAAPATTGAKPAAASASGGKINVNTANAEQLAELNGVGPSTAAKIIEYRTTHGPFKTVDELDNVSGIGPATIAKFKDQATVN